MLTNKKRGVDEDEKEKGDGCCSVQDFVHFLWGNDS
jgi:hypothetical protein